MFTGQEEEKLLSNNQQNFLTGLLYNLHRHCAKDITNFQRKSHVLPQPGSDRNPRSQHHAQFCQLLQITLCSLAKNGQCRALTIKWYPRHRHFCLGADCILYLKTVLFSYSKAFTNCSHKFQAQINKAK